MKFNFQGFAYLAFAALIGFTSCTKDDEETPAPTITVNTNSLGADQTGGTAASGAIVTVNLTAEASEGIAKLTATKTVGGSETTLSGYPVTSGFNSSTKHTWNATYTVVETSGTVALKFSVEDKKGKISSKTFTITVSGASDFSTWTAKLLSAPTSNGSSLSWFTSSIGGTHPFSEAQTNSSLVDFGYYVGTNLGSSLASPGDYPAFIGYDLSGWTTKNLTEFRTTTGVDFSTVSGSSAIGTAFDGGSPTANGVASPSARIIGLTENQVVGFKTAAGKKGLLLVKSIVPGVSGSITFDVKVQK